MSRSRFKKLDPRIAQARKNQMFQTPKFQHRTKSRASHQSTAGASSSTSTTIIMLLLLATLIPPLANATGSQSTHKEQPKKSSDLPAAKSASTDRLVTLALENHIAQPPVMRTNIQPFNITSLIWNITKRDSESSPDIRPQCDKLKRNVENALQYEHHEHISRVLKEPQFKIICLDSKRAAQIPKTDPEASIMGMFSYPQKLMLFDVETREFSLDSISHEFLHADAFFRHRTNRCYSDTEADALTPIFPHTPENIKKYNEAFALGDKRVQEFEDLYFKNVAGRKLSTQEKTQLNKYIKACRDCVPYEGVLRFGDDYQTAYERKSSHAPLIEDNKYFGEIEVKHAKKVGQHFHVDYKLTSPIQAVLHARYRLKRMMDVAIYKNSIEGWKLSERETYILSHLSKEAAQTFYPEVYAMRADDIKKCAQAPHPN